MKYLIDIDSLKSVINLLPMNTIDHQWHVNLESVKKLIDSFPKEEVKEESENNIPTIIDIDTFKETINSKINNLPTERFKTHRYITKETERLKIVQLVCREDVIDIINSEIDLLGSNVIINNNT